MDADSRIHHCLIALTVCLRIQLLRKTSRCVLVSEGASEGDAAELRALHKEGISLGSVVQSRAQAMFGHASALKGVHSNVLALSVSLFKC